jgi:hypothetical protein
MDFRSTLGVLVLLLLFGTDASESRIEEDRRVVALEQDAFDEGLDCFKVVTPVATYLLEKVGFGLSSVLDRDGRDWLGFAPTKGSRSAGEFRGFPNAVNRQAGDYFHPLNAGTQPSDATVDFERPGHVRISAVSSNGLWKSRFDFFPTHCTFTMTAMPEGFAYWVLYEGTPGGSFELDDWWISSRGGDRQPMTVEHQGPLPSPSWIAFGDRAGERAVLLLHHEDDDHPDNFYQMENNMTVFGFGRQRGQKFLATVPQSVSIGFVESVEPEIINRALATMRTAGHE